MSLRDAYQEKLDAQIEEIAAELALAKAKAKRLAADGKIVAYEELAQTEERLASLKQKAKDMKASGEGAFKDMQTGVEKAWAELRAGATNAFGRFK